MDRERLSSLAREIAACRICRDHPAYGDPLPQEPRPVLTLSGEASVCICGQAPGIRAHEAHKPFFDPSGDRLREWLGVAPAQFYDPRLFSIVPMGFCFPGYDSKGGDKPPRRECAARWHDRIFAPPLPFALIIAVGQYAHAYHLGRSRRENLTETVRHWRDYVAAAEGPVVLPLPHPSWRNNAWLRKNPWFAEELVPFLQDRVRALIDGKEILEKAKSRE